MHMKKAKIILQAIGILTIVSVAIAFKVRKTNVHIWTATTQDQCIRATSITTTDACPPGITIYYTLQGPPTGITTTCSLTACITVVE